MSQVEGTPAALSSKRGWALFRRLVLATAGYGAAFFLIDLPHGPEHWSADLLTTWMAETLPSQHPKIVLVEISESTLPVGGYLEPVDRKIIAELVDRLDDAGAQVIALDFVFDRPTEAAKDAELLAALKKAKSKVVLGWVNSHNSQEAAYLKQFSDRSGAVSGYLYFDPQREEFVISDYVVRDMADDRDFASRPSFAEVIAKEAGSFVPPKSGRIAWLGTPRNGDDTFLTLAAETILTPDILSMQELKSLINGKIVIVGGDFSDRDQHLTPLSVLDGRRYPGAFIQSQIVAQMTDPQRRPIYATPWTVWTFAVLCSLAVGFLFGRSKRLHRWGAWKEILVVVGLIVTSIAAMAMFRLTFPFVAALLAWGLGETASADVTLEEEGSKDVKTP